MVPNRCSTTARHDASQAATSPGSSVASTTPVVTFCRRAAADARELRLRGADVHDVEGQLQLRNSREIFSITPRDSPHFLLVIFHSLNPPLVHGFQACFEVVVL